MNIARIAMLAAPLALVSSFATASTDGKAGNDPSGFNDRGADVTVSIDEDKNKQICILVKSPGAECDQNVYNGEKNFQKILVIRIPGFEGTQTVQDGDGNRQVIRAKATGGSTW